MKKVEIVIGWCGEEQEGIRARNWDAKKNGGDLGDVCELEGNLLVRFAVGAIELTEHLVKAVFDTMKGEIPSARVVDLAAAKRFFVLSETVPGVVRVGGGSHAPKVVKFGTVFLGINYGLDADDRAGGEVLVLAAGGSVGIITNAVVVVNEGGSDGLVFIFNDVESGEAGLKLIFKMTFVLRGEVPFGA